MGCSARSKAEADLAGYRDTLLCTGPVVARERCMSVRRIVGLALVAVGMVILLWGGIFWRDRDTIVDTGPLKVETSERKGVAFSPMVGAAVLVGGIILVLVPSRRKV